MIRDPGKIVNLDRPRDDVPDAVAGDAPAATPDPAPDQADALDEIVSQFLQKANSLAADYESRHETTTEQLDALLSDLDPTPEVGRKMAELAASMPPAGAGFASAAEAYRSDAPEPSSAPLPFPAPTPELDEDISHTLDELEKLPEPEAPEQAPPPVKESPAALEPEFLAHGTLESAARESPVVVEAAPAPHREAMPPDVALFDHRTPLTPAPRRTLTARLLIRLAVISVLIIAGVVIYLLSTSKPRNPPEARPVAAAAEPPDSGTPAPSAPEAQSIPDPAPVTARPAAGSRARSSSRGQTTAQPPRSQDGARSGSGLQPQSLVRPVQVPDAQPPGNRPAEVPSSGAPPQSTAAAQPVPQNVTVAPAATPPKTTEAPHPPPVVPAPQAVSAQKEEVRPPVPAQEPPTAVVPSPAPPAAPPNPVTTPAPAGGTAPAPESTARAPGTQAVLVSKVLPNFPEFARSRRVSGRVDLQIEIDAQGHVVSAKPISGPQIFHAAAVDAVRKWRFRPASLGGNNVASEGKVTVVFNYQR